MIKYPISTEKAIRLMESQNTLLFAVDKKATKQEIKMEVEKEFKVKITNVRTMITKEGEKRAYVQFSKETPALDVATALGLM